MPATRFDIISKMFGQRLSRRTALRGTGTGLAGAGLASPTAFAQDATPPATPTAEGDNLHPNAGPDNPTFFFTQAFEGGTWEPKAGMEGVYTLTLSGAPAQTVHFSDRPDRIFGVAPTQQFLDTIGFGADDPPNAALVTNDPETGDADTLIIELLNPQYDASSATLTYDARVLADYQESALSHAATRQQDFDFPASFDQGGLFIDTACHTDHYWCETPDGDPVGTIAVDRCFNHFNYQCRKCHNADDACRDKFPYPCTNAFGDNRCKATEL